MLEKYLTFKVKYIRGETADRWLKLHPQKRFNTSMDTSSKPIFNSIARLLKSFLLREDITHFYFLVLKEVVSIRVPQVRMKKRYPYGITCASVCHSQFAPNLLDQNFPSNRSRPSGESRADIGWALKWNNFVNGRFNLVEEFIAPFHDN